MVVAELQPQEPEGVTIEVEGIEANVGYIIRVCPVHGTMRFDRISSNTFMCVHIDHQDFIGGMRDHARDAMTDR